ncbi:putative F-box/kelch-repeat protein [Raphanus sativus]|uniref:F-box/kelch-repeat protein At3g22730 n=1 Tax=Raphanus sativus TaxID=3726 RepID=A0A6J0JIN4_RAPSA|nr:putative F-box/kelch-repeat protein At3g22730 [Raphanus sativus]KAJ4887208.1 putative F-box/kelch-repeat protein [Raphanus sativus]
MMISDLPHHLLEEILSRVPATTLRRLRTTCKQWNALLKDQLFTEKHHRKAPKQPLLLMLKEFRICPLSVELDLSVNAPSIEFKDALNLKKGSHSSSQDSDIMEVFHCEGLLLCVTRYNKLLVWNPLLGETKWIHHYKEKSSYALGYKNKESCHRDYKILRYRQSPKREDNVDEFEIYEFSSDSWRFLDGISLDYYIQAIGYVSLQGNTYWVASDRKDDYSMFLLSFDFTTERFIRLNLPPVPSTMMLLSLVREEQISVLHMNHFQLKMELWVTSNFGTETALSWSKSFEVDLHVLDSERYPFFTTFLLDEDKKVVVCPGPSGLNFKNVVYIIGENDEYHKEIPYVRSTQEPWLSCIFNYVPSLVQIQQPTQTRKRKRRSKLEHAMLVTKKQEKKRRHSIHIETVNVD